MSFFDNKTGKMSFLSAKLGNSRKKGRKMLLFATKSGKILSFDDGKENGILCW